MALEGGMRDDGDFNIEFCKLIHEFPALYDYNRADYTKRHVQNKIWREIAKKVGAKDTECKERWKNIRGRYSKFMKTKVITSCSPTPKRVREYYLTPYLHFLDPFLKRRKPKNKQTSSDSSDDDDRSEHAVWPPPRLSPVSETHQEIKSQDRRLEPELNIVTETSVNVAPTPSDPIDPDLGFLYSLLPDMKAMTAAQKRRFKIEALNLATQILDSDQGRMWRNETSLNGSALYECSDTIIGMPKQED